MHPDALSSLVVCWFFGNDGSLVFLFGFLQWVFSSWLYVEAKSFEFALEEGFQSYNFSKEGLLKTDMHLHQTQQKNTGNGLHVLHASQIFRTKHKLKWDNKLHTFASVNPKPYFCTLETHLIVLMTMKGQWLSTQELSKVAA